METALYKMITRCEMGRIKSAVDFIQSGISSDPQSGWLKIEAGDGVVKFRILGLANYETSFPAKVMRPGECLVSSKIFCELIGKLKKLKDVVTMAQFPEKPQLSILGEGFGYEFQLVANEVLPQVQYGREMDGIFSIPLEVLAGIIANMKVIKDAESDVECPACEILINKYHVRFSSFSRYRSVVTKIHTQKEIRSGVDEVRASIAIEHLQRMDKAVKALIARGDSGCKFVLEGTRVKLSLMSAQDEQEYEDSISLRTLVMPPSKIDFLIDLSMDPKNQRATLLINTAELKDAYSRLDVFGKRNETSIHKMIFRIKGLGISIQSFGASVGAGIENLIALESNNMGEEIKFAVAGNKLADLLRISGGSKKDKTVKMIICTRNICLVWNSEDVTHLAILAGMAV